MNKHYTKPVVFCYIVVEIFNNNGGITMATVNLSVPEEVKTEFNHYFTKENKSAILTKLMLQAIEDRKKQAIRSRAIQELLEFRKTQPSLSDEEIAKARRQLRE